MKNYLDRFTLFLIFSLFTIGCNRAQMITDGKSQIEFKMPNASKIHEQIKLFGETLPIGKQICFAVNVTGTGISNSINEAGTCHSKFGLISGFAQDGTTLSLEVPKGNSRNFELYMYLADSGSPCPSLDFNFFDSNINYAKTFLVGTSNSVNLNSDKENVNIQLQFQGLTKSLLAQSGQVSCGTTDTDGSKLRGVLFNDGSISKVDTQDPSGFNLVFSDPLISSILTSAFEIFDLSGLSFVTTSSSQVIGSSELSGMVVDLNLPNLPEYLFSYSRDPVTGKVFALDYAGQIYEVDIVTGEATLMISNCPFAKCEIPLWVQSISVGLAGKLYVLDHGGQIYRVDASSEPISLNNYVSATVQQIIYY